MADDAGPEAFIPRVTRRCLVDDLGFDKLDVDLSIDELAERSDVIVAFRDRRAEVGSVGQEPIRLLRPGLTAFSLHVGRNRGATWLHREAGIIWLLAVGYHREGAADDAYQYFSGLQVAGNLLPVREDILAYVRSQAPTLARSLLEDVPPLLDAVRSHPGEIQSALIGGQVAVRVIYEDSEPPMLTVAISQRLRPGEMTVPADWLLRVAAAFLPDTPPERLAFAFDLGGRELFPDEAAFCDFAD